MTTLVDILVDGAGNDVEKVSDGTVYREGKRISYDGTEYMFRQSSNYEGIAFKLRSDLQESESDTLLISPGEACFEFKLASDTEWKRGNEEISLGEMDDDTEVEVDIRVSPYYQAPVDMNLICGFLQVYDETYSDGLVFTTYVVNGDTEPLILRITSISEDVYDKMVEFGVTVS
jgi:hypothetical protein